MLIQSFLILINQQHPLKFSLSELLFKYIKYLVFCIFGNIYQSCTLFLLIELLLNLWQDCEDKWQGKRHLGQLFQTLLLFEHLNVLIFGFESVKNLDFALQCFKNSHWFLNVLVSLLVIERADVYDFMLTKALQKLAIDCVAWTWSDKYHDSVIVNCLQWIVYVYILIVQLVESIEEKKDRFLVLHMLESLLQEVCKKFFELLFSAFVARKVS